MFCFCNNYIYIVLYIILYIIIKYSYQLKFYIFIFAFIIGFDNIFAKMIYFLIKKCSVNNNYLFGILIINILNIKY